MIAPVGAAQADRLRALVAPYARGSVTEASMRLPVERVRDALGLPDIPHAHFLGGGCWLMGGSLLRWLCGQLGPENNPGDFDLFFESRAALERTAVRLLRAGYVPKCFSLKGSPWDRRRKRIYNPVPDLSALPEEEMLLYLHALATRPGLVAVDFRAPNGDLIQLSGVSSRASAQEILALADYTVCQMVMDGRDLHVGRYTWTDLMEGRLRANQLGYPPIAMRRLVKYWKRGFRPDASTVGKVAGAVLGGRWRWPA
ncbi:MAG: hypothetical protein KY467_03630 [Gemmatimonadetes bacterium]|nr:hypothetical protein [Gemmatimonadota bacterium]